jgi:hypothetical protein
MARGRCYRCQLQKGPALGPCHPRDRRRLNPCQDSDARVPKASRSDASVASALAADLAGLHNADAGGMARLRDPARHRWRCGELPVRSGRGGESAQAPTWPEGPKEGSRRPARRGSPVVASQLRATPAPPAVSGCLARRYPGAVASRIRRAERALEDVEQVVTNR